MDHIQLTEFAVAAAGVSALFVEGGGSVSGNIDGSHWLCVGAGTHFAVLGGWHNARVYRSLGRLHIRLRQGIAAIHP